MSKLKKLRLVDRAIIFIIGLLHTIIGIYTVSPYYMYHSEAGKAPLAYVFGNPLLIDCFGVIMIINGLTLLYLSIRNKATRRFNTAIIYSILAAFSIRLYFTIGMVMSLPPRPPHYVYNIALVLICAVMWLHLRVESESTR